MVQVKEALEWEGWADWTSADREQPDGPGRVEWRVLRDDGG
jgi:hypothetical protein